MATVPQMARFKDLNVAERAVLDAVAAGEPLDLEKAPEDARLLRAGFLRRLIGDENPDWPSLRGALRICGAVIEGPLRAPWRNEHVGAPGLAISFQRCTFDSLVDFSGAEFLSVRIIESSLPAFIGASLSTRADLDLSGSSFAGVAAHQSEFVELGICSVYLANARIGGRLDMSARAGKRFSACGEVRLDGAKIEGLFALSGARIDARGDMPALSARAVSVGGDVDMTPEAGWRFEACGEVIFAASRVGGDLNANAAVINNPNGRSLHCEDLVVESVNLSRSDDWPFVSHGRLNFLSAIVGGSFFLTNARLTPWPDYEGQVGKGGPVAVNLRQIRVSNALAFSNVGRYVEGEEGVIEGVNRQPLASWVLLAGANVTVLIDNPETGWPEPGFLEIEGISYTNVFDMTLSGGDAAQRIEWLRRQFPNGVATCATFRPQPFEQLSKVMRDSARTREADEIAVEKIRARLEAKVDPGAARILPRILMFVSLHGYSSGRATLSFASFIALGAVFYALALFVFGQPFLPVEIDPAPTRYLLPFGLAARDVQEGCPGLNLFVFALDSALPVVDLGQSSYCRFAPQGAGAGVWTMLHAAFVLTGAALSAIVILTLTGVLRRD